MRFSSSNGSRCPPPPMSPGCGTSFQFFLHEAFEVSITDYPNHPLPRGKKRAATTNHFLPIRPWLKATVDGAVSYKLHAFREVGNKETNGLICHPRPSKWLMLKFHLARLDSTHSTCRAHAFWLCRASRTAQLDSLDTTNSTGSTGSTRRARQALLAT